MEFYEEMFIHLKIEKIYFEAIENNKKTCEIRKNDRDFRVGDIIVLHEYDLESEQQTGKTIELQITWIDTYYQQNNYVVLSFCKKKR